jgi:hypothetical protein
VLLGVLVLPTLTSAQTRSATSASASLDRLINRPVDLAGTSGVRSVTQRTVILNPVFCSIEPGTPNTIKKFEWLD